MTDIFVAYARQDREAVRRVVRALEAEGWDVWCDPSEPRADAEDFENGKLAEAAAVLVLWSFNARYADHVRSEAATGLYRNRLVQARIDSVSPPRPFDQIEVIDLGVWGGGREDLICQSLLSALRRTAGPPARAPLRIEPERKSARRTPVFGPIIAAALLIAAGAAAWTVDPFGWRSSESVAETRASKDETGPRVEFADSGRRLSDAGGVEESAASRPPSGENVDPTTPAPVNSPAPNSAEESEANAGSSSASSSADALAAQSLRSTDDAAWRAATRAATPAAYATYLETWPSGAHVADARAAMLLPPQTAETRLPVDVSASVNAAREAAALADRQATAARDRAAEADRAAQSAADGQAGYARVTSANGLIFAGRIVDGGFTGPGVRTGASGDVQRYRGELRAGTATGLGVLEYASGSAARRYEGEVAGDRPTASGVTVWADGGRYAGTAARGVLTYADGRRYEGDMRDGAPEGKGALWSASGALLQAGAWSRGQPLPR